jgi:hypothetical protein
VHQAADLLVRTVPEPPHAAVLALLLPKQRIDMSLSVERRHEFVAVARRPRGKLL